MLFEVTRVSVWDRKVKPCEEAMPAKFVDVDCRTCASPEEFIAKKFKRREENGKHMVLDRWFDFGTNHRIEDGMIARDTGYEDGWSIEIDTMGALLAFIERHGDIVISSGYGRPTGHLELEIYDAYRE